MVKTERFDIRVSYEAKELIREAAELQDVSLSSFMVAAAVDKARRVIRQAEGGR